MELISQDYRLYIEPIRVILHASSISFKENHSGKKQKELSLLTEENKTIQDYQEVVKYASDKALNSAEWQQNNGKKSPEDAVEFNNKNILKLQTIYLQIADAIASKSSLPSPPEDLLKEYIELISHRTFLAGAAWTPADAFFYEIIRTLEAVYLRPKNDVLYKYVERFETLTYVRAYIIDSTTYLRPFTENLQSLVTQRKEIFEEKLQTLCGFVMSEGVIMANQKEISETNEVLDLTVHMPFNCYPKKISKQEFTELVNIQHEWNVLLNAMGRDFEWYSSHLTEMIEREDFVRRLYNISKKCKSYPHTQKIFFAMLRNDFMYQSMQNRWLQVEYNVIAITFMPFSDKVQQFQKEVVQNYFEQESADFDVSNNMDLLEEALVTAFKCYGNPKAIVLVIVLPKFETNIYEQRAIEKRLFSNGIQCIRASFEDVYKNHKFDESTGTLHVHGYEVGLVYFRAGYQPDHYIGEEDWKAREVIELSRAIKCPTVDYQMINFKIFQVYLAQDAKLAKFFPKAEEREKIKKNFAGFWDLEDATKIPKLLEMVEANPSLYILKPQREGGANNYFGDDIINLFKTLSSDELSTYILMEKIDSTPHVGYLVKNKNMVVAPCTSELGIYGYILSDPDKIIKSGVGGTLVRTKAASSNEGGVTAGFGVLDSFIFE